MIDKVLILGTSSDLNQFNTGYFLQKKSEGYKIFAYSDSIMYLERIGISPDYWSFLDPNCLRRYYDRLGSDFFKDVHLVVPDLFDNRFQNFYKEEFSTKVLEKDEVAYKTVSSLNLSSYFTKYTKLPYKVVKYVMPKNGKYKLSTSFDLRENYFLFKREDNNFCKFTHILLPLLVYYFKELKHILSIGFGHYDLPRYCDQNNTKGYDMFKMTFGVAEDMIKANLNKYGIELAFDGSPSFYNSLTNG